MVMASQSGSNCLCRTYGARLHLKSTHTSGFLAHSRAKAARERGPFAYARLRCGLTCGRASGAWNMVRTNDLANARQRSRLINNMHLANYHCNLALRDLTRFERPSQRWQEKFSSPMNLVEDGSQALASSRIDHLYEAYPPFKV